MKHGYDVIPKEPITQKSFTYVPGIARNKAPSAKGAIDTSARCPVPPPSAKGAIDTSARCPVPPPSAMATSATLTHAGKVTNMAPCAPPEGVDGPAWPINQLGGNRREPPPGVLPWPPGVLPWPSGDGGTRDGFFAVLGAQPLVSLKPEVPPSVPPGVPLVSTAPFMPSLPPTVPLDPSLVPTVPLDPSLVPSVPLVPSLVPSVPLVPSLVPSLVHTAPLVPPLHPTASLVPPIPPTAPPDASPPPQERGDVPPSSEAYEHPSRFLVGERERERTCG
ncbi:wiskott-Aldrich syndrome protein homolog 1-like [Penaeus monodon]|uniref:wiskott-Aldrich syndrome protein homolog 1-like n=1 Tax=Penaeus monodon TaxID=6687 RepID=UPI0018A6DBE6|nr:wiskott-Aldrich syndrome protein homolog 1-like [Penaeus monodon]